MKNQITELVELCNRLESDINEKKQILLKYQESGSSAMKTDGCFMWNPNYKAAVMVLQEQSLDKLIDVGGYLWTLGTGHENFMAKLNSRLGKEGSPMVHEKMWGLYSLEEWLHDVFMLIELKTMNIHQVRLELNELTIKYNECLDCLPDEDKKAIRIKKLLSSNLIAI